MLANPANQPAQKTRINQPEREAPTYPFGRAPAYGALPPGVGVTLTASGAIKTAGQAEVDTCTICREAFTVDEVAQPAGRCPHYFHGACLAAWAYPSNAFVCYNPNDPRAFPSVRPAEEHFTVARNTRPHRLHRPLRSQHHRIRRNDLATRTDRRGR